VRFTLLSLLFRGRNSREKRKTRRLGQGGKNRLEGGHSVLKGRTSEKKYSRTSAEPGVQPCSYLLFRGGKENELNLQADKKRGA